MRDVPKHNLLVVLGDFNGHLDKNSMKFSYHGKSNKNGKLVANFIQVSDLFVANGHFQKRDGKKWTFISDMSGRKTQVDFMMVNKKWKNSIHNREAYNTFSSIGSDRHIFTAKIKLNLRCKPEGSLYGDSLQ